MSDIDSGDKAFLIGFLSAMATTIICVITAVYFNHKNTEEALKAGMEEVYVVGHGTVWQKAKGMKESDK